MMDPTEQEKISTELDTCKNSQSKDVDRQSLPLEDEEIRRYSSWFEGGDMKIDPTKNTVVCGDNFEWLNWIPDESVDLCYIDPPFFTQGQYKRVWGNGWEVASFKDSFSGGKDKYQSWMEDRLHLIHKKLKSNGSIFVHCDHNANHYLKMSLDEIFGEKNFCNEIIWKRTPFKGSSKSKSTQLPVEHDTIFYYQKTAAHKFKFKCPTQLYTDKYLKRFKYKDEHGYYRITCLKTYSQETYEKHKREGTLILPKKSGAKPSYKQYLHESSGKTQIGDLWTDINMLNPNSSDREEYPTQKPSDLVKRIIEMASNSGDVVLDCFVGGGTTAKAAIETGRKFIVGDVSPVAIKVTCDMVNPDSNVSHELSDKFEIKGFPKTINQYRKLSGHKFAEIVCDIMGWKINPKRSNDGGVDGWDGNRNPLQIKNSEIGRPDVNKFHGVLTSLDKKCGVMVGWSFSRDAKEYVAKIRKQIDIQLRTPDDIFGRFLIHDEKSQEIEKFYIEKSPSRKKSTPTKIAS